IDNTAGKVAMVAALNGAEGSFGVKSSADRLLPELLGSAGCCRPGGGAEVHWVGFALALALAVPMLPAGARGLRDAGLVRTNYRGAALAFPLGAILATVSLVALGGLARPLGGAARRAALDRRDQGDRRGRTGRLRGLRAGAVDLALRRRRRPPG